MAEKKIQSFQDLPDWVKDQVLDKKTVEKNKKIVKDFNLSEKQKGIFFAGLRGVILKKISPYEILDFLKNIDLSENNRKKLALRIIQDRLLPLQEYFKEDIRKIYTKVGGKLNKEQKQEYKPKQEIKLDQKVDDIIEKGNLEFDSEEMRQRFEDIITLYFKGAQSRVETEILLKRNKDIGGLGFDKNIIEEILNLCDKATDMSRASNKKDKAYKNKDEKKKKEEIKENKKDQEKAKKDLKKSPAKETKKTNQKEKPALENTEKIVSQKENKKEQEKKGKNLSKKEEAKDLEKEPSSKDQKKGINIFSRSHGPIDELRILTLEDWRRWGDSKEAAQNIKDKINLLGEESLEKKSKAIKAWKQSEIYNLYLKIGKESINKGKSIKELIQDRKEADKPTLTQEEFNVILDLNEDLRF